MGEERQKSNRVTLLAIAVSRIAGSLILLGLYVFTKPTMPAAASAATWAVGIWVGASLAYLGIRTFRPQTDVESTILVLVPLDAVALGLSTFAFKGAYDDPFHVWYLVEAVFAARTIRIPRSWLVGALLALSYVLAHMTIGVEVAFPDYVFFAADALMIFAAAWVASIITKRQRERGEHLEVQQAEMLGLNRRLERSVSELRALTEFTETIHSTLDLESVGPRLLGIVQRITDIPAASLFVLDQRKQETVFSVSSGLPPEHSVPRDPVSLDSNGNMGSYSCIDLAEHGDIRVVFCADSGVMENLSENNRLVLGAIASQLVVAVENSRLYKLTKRLAITDEITGLHNYRYLQQRLDEEVGRAKRYDKRLSFLMLDVDEFKTINDVHGHRVGDAVLAGIAEVLLATVREVDVVARYGGEEFSVVLPETDASGAFIVAEKIRETIGLHRFPDAEGVNRIHATISIGLASFPAHAHDKESLLRAADGALYHAKTTGRDRVRAPKLRLGRLPAGQSTSEEVAE